VLNIFNAWHAVLVSWYAPVVHGEKGKERYYEMTLKISKLFQFLTINIGLVFMIVGPTYLLVIVNLYHYEQVYLHAASCLIAYGFQFMLTMLYYIPPTIINLEQKSMPLLLIHLKVAGLYLLSYMALIPLVGLAGIPLGYSLGNVGFYILCKRQIEKRDFKIGFEKASFKKIVSGAIPAFAIVLVSLVGNRYLLDQTITLDLLFFKIPFPLTAFVTNIILGLAMLLIMLVTIKRHRFFSDDDKEMLSQLLGKRVFKYTAKMLF